MDLPAPIEQLPYEEKHRPFKAVVAVIDALGVKIEADTSPSIALDKLRHADASIAGSLEIVRGILSKSLAPEYLTGQDTYVLIWRTDQVTAQILSDVASWCGMLFYSLLGKPKIKLRGAVAFGDCIIDERRILMKAFVDAYKAEMLADWLGFIATPSLADEIDRVRGELDVEQLKALDLRWCRYSVPIKPPCQKEIIKQDFYTVVWPYQYRFSEAMDLKHYGVSGRELLESQLESLDFGKSVCKKDHTYEFFDWVAANVDLATVNPIPVSAITDVGSFYVKDEENPTDVAQRVFEQMREKPQE